MDSVGHSGGAGLLLKIEMATPTAPSFLRLMVKAGLQSGTVMMMGDAVAQTFMGNEVTTAFYIGLGFSHYDRPTLRADLRDLPLLVVLYTALIFSSASATWTKFSVLP